MGTEISVSARIRAEYVKKSQKGISKYHCADLPGMMVGFASANVSG